jgi:site-specific recombinase XerD
MAIYQRGKSYYYDFVYKGQRYAGCIGPVSRTVAKEEEARKKAEVIEGRLNPAKTRKSPRFDAFAAEYLEWVEANRKPLTYLQASVVVKTLTATFGPKRLNELTAWHMEQYKKARKDAGMAPATINKELAFLKGILNKAVAWKKLAEHPGKDVKAFKVANERTRFLTEEEEARLLIVCSPALQRIVEAGLLTGFRRQELVSLRPEDLDFNRETVSVAACYSKNGESRTLPMGERMKAVLHEALTVCGDAPTVFVTESGKPWLFRNFSSVFSRACQRAGIDLCSPHTLRHTFASRLVMAGVDLRTVQELLGHKNIKMTLRYTHLSPSHKRQAMAALEQRFPAQKSHQFSQHPSSSHGQSVAKVVNFR